MIFCFLPFYFYILCFYLFISFFLPDFWYVLWVGVEMFLKKAQTLWLIVYLSSSSLSLHTKIQEKKKWSSNTVCDIWGLVDVREIDGCRFETLFYLLIFLVFSTTKSWFLGKLGTIGIKRKEIEDFWFLSDLSFCMKVWFFTQMGQNILCYM